MTNVLRKLALLAPLGLSLLAALAASGASLAEAAPPVCALEDNVLPRIDPDRAAPSSANNFLAALESDVGPLHLDELESDHVVVVQVGASWCEPCQRAASHVGSLQAADPRIKVVHVSVDENADDARAAAVALGLEGPIFVLDESDAVATSVREIPYTVVLRNVEGAGFDEVDSIAGFGDSERGQLERAVAR
jgi:thiol-disulfide isomerase/thioredoxin